MTVKEELLLVSEAQSGRKEAIGYLWDDITPKLYGYLVNVLREPSLAEDMLQETWLKAITALPKFRPQGVRFSAWLFAIARNECRAHWRKNNPVVQMPEEELDETVRVPSSPAPTTDKIFVEQIIGRLSTDDRDILQLRYISDLSFSEIARILDISPINARVRVHRALGKTREILKKQQPYEKK